MGLCHSNSNLAITVCQICSEHSTANSRNPTDTILVSAWRHVLVLAVPTSISSQFSLNFPSFFHQFYIFSMLIMKQGCAPRFPTKVGKSSLSSLSLSGS